MRTDAVVIFKRLVNPGVGRQFLDVVIGNGLRMPPPPQHGSTELFNSRALVHEVIAHPAEREAGIDHVVNQQHFAVDGAARNGDELRDIELTLHRTGRFTITAGSQNAQGYVKDARKDVAHPNAAACQAEYLVEFPARLVHDQRQAFDEFVVLIPGYPVITIRIGRQAHFSRFLDSHLERLVQHDGFHTVGARGDHVDGHVADFGDALEVTAGVDGQLVVFRDASRGVAPARQFFEDRLGFGNGVGAIRQHVEEFTLVAVAHADAQGLQAVEHIEFGDAQAVYAVDGHRALHGRAVEPAAAARAARDGAEFLAHFGQARTDVVVQFGGEWPRADTGGVSLCDAQNVIEHLRAHPCPGRRRTSHAIAAGDERVRAMVDVEQRALRPFEQQPRTRLGSLAEFVRDVGNHALEFGGYGHDRVTYLAGRHRLCVQILSQHEVVIVERLFEFGLEHGAIVKILHPQRPARDLVFVCRADTPTGGADLAVALARLARLIERNVVRQNERTRSRHAQA